VIIRENGDVKKVSLGRGNPRFYKINEFGSAVYVGFESGKIVKIDKELGKILWEKELGAPVNVDFGFDENNMYLVSINNDFHVLDQTAGETKFVYYNSNRVTILKQIAPAVVSEGVLVTFNDGKVILFDRTNWKILRSENFGENPMIGSDWESLR
jgi:outer membrane protein assembly factor BamB